MKVGDLVIIKEDPRACEEKEIGMIVAFEPRGWSIDPDPDCDVWNNAIVLWPSFGLSYHMKALIEVINESR
jgi:hypothetical protein